MDDIIYSMLAKVCSISIHLRMPKPNKCHDSSATLFICWGLHQAENKMKDKSCDIVQFILLGASLCTEKTCVHAKYFTLIILFSWLWDTNIAVDIEIQLMAQLVSYFTHVSIIVVSTSFVNQTDLGGGSLTGGVLPSLLFIHIVNQFISLVDQWNQLLQQQLLSQIVGLTLLPLCTAKKGKTNKG